jgi:hypothetical protein
MTIITGLTSARMLAIEAASIVSGTISGDNLILSKFSGATVNAGNVRGPKGDTGAGFLENPGNNRIINGDFSVNQRGFSSGTNNATYCFDRWKMYTFGGSITYSAQTATLATLPESAASFLRIITSGQSSANDVTYVTQKIESVRTLSAKTVVVSFWAKAGSSTPKIAVSLMQYFGVGGSAVSTHTYVGTVTLSSGWTRYSVSVTLPSISGKTIGTSDSLDLLLWVSAGSTSDSNTGSLGIQSNTFDIWGVQLEEGSVASAFKQKSYAEELRACQRYYATGKIRSRIDSFPVAVGFSSLFPVAPMRTTPTMTGTASLGTLIYIDANDASSCYLEFSAGTFGNVTATWTANAEI